MFIKKSSQKNRESVENKSGGSFSLFILSICLIVIIIINFIQLIELVKNINELNETLKTISNVSNNYASLNELKTNYIVQLVKAIFVLIAEVSGLFICGYFSNKLALKNQQQNTNELE